MEGKIRSRCVGAHQNKQITLFLTKKRTSWFYMIIILNENSSKIDWCFKTVKQ